MSFFAVLLALLIEQARPLPRMHPLREVVRGWVRWTTRNLDAGGAVHAWVTLLVTLAVPVLLSVALWRALASVHPVLAFVLNVGVLYLTVGFRQFSHVYTAVRDALDRGDEDEARRLVARWRKLDASELPRTEVLRHVIEQSLLEAHRSVFGPFFWFVWLAALGLGPAGAVLYRVADQASRQWSRQARSPDGLAHRQLAELAQKAFDRIDWLPARLTAAGFAIVGDFEAAVNAWRRDAGLWRHRNEGVMLAAASGAVGVRLGVPAPGGSTVGSGNTGASDETALMPVAAQSGHLQTVVGLVWRSVVLWMLLLALLTLANVFG